MKRTIAFLLSVLMLTTMVLPVAAMPSAAETESQAVLDSVIDYIDDNTVVTQNADGTMSVTLAPVMSNAPRAYSDVTVVAQEPAYAAAHADYGYVKNQQHEAVPLEDRFLYSLLDDEHKAYYRQLDAVARGIEERVTFDGETELLSSGSLYFMYMFDTPELFYLGNTTTLYYSAAGIGFMMCYAADATDYCNYGHDPSTITPDLRQRILDKQAVFNRAVSDFLATIPSDAPDVIKERLIYAKILRRSYYNLGAQWRGIAEDNWTAYGIMVNGYGVCESYTESFQLLCNAVGIRCTAVIGTAGGPHKWNAVNIGGDWYQCDITFDDPIGGAADAAYDSYFNLTDEQMAYNGHDWTGCEFEVPTCIGTAYGRDAFRALYEEDANGTIHCFLNRCDSTCENCDFTRTVPDHELNADRVCIHCGYCKTHRYSGACDAQCNECGEFRTPTADHRFTDDGDEYCDVCSFHREVKNGWVQEGTKWAYYLNGQKVTNSWMQDSVGWCCLGKDGYMKTNEWVRDSVGWCYVGANGYCVTNTWKKDSKGWCYLNASGRMAVNQWIKDSVGWCYVGGDGYCVTNVWKKDSHGWCYLNASGRMATNAWVRDSVGWCYVGADGYAVTNCWKRDSVGWCYLNANGSMTKSAWVKDGGKWYYLDGNGYMLYSTSRYIGNKTYNFNASGVCTNP